MLREEQILFGLSFEVIELGIPEMWVRWTLFSCYSPESDIKLQPMCSRFFVNLTRLGNWLSCEHSTCVICFNSSQKTWNISSIRVFYFIFPIPEHQGTVSTHLNEPDLLFLFGDIMLLRFAVYTLSNLMAMVQCQRIVGSPPGEPSSPWIRLVWPNLRRPTKDSLDSSKLCADGYYRS